MFHLAGQNLVPFVCLGINATLVAFVLYSKRVRLKNLFLSFLLAGLGINAVSLLVNVPFSYELLTVWKSMLPIFSAWSIVAYVHFILAYTNRPTGKVARYGYIWLGLNALAAGTAGISLGTGILGHGGMVTFWSDILFWLIIINDIMLVAASLFIVKLLRTARQPEEKNRASFLVLGLGCMLIAGLLKYAFHGYYVFPGIGILVNAVCILYTFTRYRLFNFQALIRKSVVYGGITISMTLVYLTLLLGMSNYLQDLPPNIGIPAMVAALLLFGFIFNWFKNVLDRFAQRLFYGERYKHRQMLLSFAGQLNSLLNIKEIADALLIPLAKTVNASQAGLMLPNGQSYTTKYITRLQRDSEAVPAVLSGKSHAVHWLTTNGKPLSHDEPGYRQFFEMLSERDQESVETARIRVLTPVISKGNLVGIITLGQKDGETGYTRDEIDLLSNLAGESAVAIENAQIYQNARNKAERDGLTGLYNHRTFQELLNREIEESTASGGDFSLLIIDLDFFKTYNDIYGHLLGDEILKDIGRIITKCIRKADAGARYGGDEFAVILRGSDSEQARGVAERIRVNLEAAMNEKGILLTCSIGAASWRTDGVMRGTMIQAADEALGAAKQAGRNRVCVARDCAENHASAANPITSWADNQAAVESIVFALASTVDARDHYTFGHSKAVSRYATDLAREIGYGKEDIRRIRSAGLLHDIGKLNLPDNILNKQDKLTDIEWEMIKNHPTLALNILKYVVGLRDCVEAVLYHHERWDGTGYPRGLKEKEIPLDARIIAIADAYDAMLSKRNYKTGELTEEAALEEIERSAGTHFDPNLAETFVRIRRSASFLEASKRPV